MPAIVFWILVAAAVVFFMCTSPADRRAIIETYWVMIVIMGIIGFAWQFLRQGTLSV